MNPVKRHGKVSRWIVAAVVVAIPCLIVLYLVIGRNGPPSGPRPGPPGPGPEPNDRSQIEKVILAAYDLQVDGKLSGAKEQWDKALEMIDAQGHPDYLADLRDRAERNLEQIGEMQRENSKTTVSIEDHPDPPEKVPEATLEEYYPVGRKIRSVATVLITGTGTNERWFWKQEASFLYQYRVAVETEVVGNDGTELEFVQNFVEVVQERAVCDKSVRLRSLSPIAEQVFRVFEEAVLYRFPIYVHAKRLGEIAGIVDPGAERILTRLAEMLEAAGLASDEFELAAQVEKLHGTRLRLKYWSGLGVTNIKVEKGPEGAFNQTDLERIAYGSSLLMDYFVFPGAKRKVGETWEVDARDVGSLFNLYDVTVDGTVALRRAENETLDDRPVAVLEILGGELAAEGEMEGGMRSATLRPKQGTVDFSTEGLFVERAQVTWHASDEWFSKRHLLFGTTRTRDMEMRTVYQARRPDSLWTSPPSTP